MKTAVIYARYSSDNQTEQSIEGQLRVCNEYAKSNDIVILNTYIDRAMTGTNDNRPDFQRMIKDSSRKEWNYVLVYKFDRFSRNKYETAIHKKTLKDNGVKVISAMEYIPDSPEAIILESMLEGYAEYYSAELSQKVKRGNNESRRKGNLTGGKIPYGYKSVNKKAVIVPEQAEVVRYMYEQYSKGVYVKDIIDVLTNKGILHYGKPFKKTTVYAMLSNERYSGKYHFNGELFDNIYPQIIETALFEKVRDKVLSNKYGKKSESITYLLKDKIVCGYCGMSIVGENGTARNGERKYYYKCRGRKSRITDCHKQAVRKDVLESIVLDAILNELNNPQMFNAIVKGVLQEQQRQAQNNTVLNLLNRELHETENAINNIMVAIEKGVITNTTTKRLKELESRQEELQRQILIEQSKTVVILKESDIRDFYNQALALEPRMLISYLIKRIVLFDDKIEIHFNNPIIGSPDNRGFLLCEKSVKLAYKIPQRINIMKLEFVIELYV
ncbi:MAG: recombinase family protein [Clostridiales bacterium]|nr:recombinase family protein [Clostridiales bacterium]